MRTEQIIVSEKGIALHKASLLLLKFIENQITAYNEQQLIEWERDHTISQKETEEKMAYLKEQKEKLKFLLNHSNQSDQVDLTLSLGVVVHSTNTVNPR